jgi:ribonuclease HII
MLCGIDEAGRGPLAGPVYVAAVVLGDVGRAIKGINDSKKLTEKKRDALAIEIKQNALAWSIVAIDEATIDSINILQATLLGMQRAFENLRWQHAMQRTVNEIVVDGTQLPRALVAACGASNIALRAAPKADADVLEVGAASILAKTARDAYMIELEARFPGYGFAKHKGYGTADHIAAIHRIGPCAAHRKTFAPVSQLTLL